MKQKTRNKRGSKQAMSWELRDGRRYYYRARKVRGRVVKEYCGPGKIGELCEQMDAIKKQMALRERIEKDLLFIDTCGGVLDVDDFLRTERAQIKVVVSAVLTAAGYAQHKRGEWRKKRMGIDLSAPATAEESKASGAKPKGKAKIAKGEPGYIIEDKAARYAFVRRVTKDTYPTSAGEVRGDKDDEARALACLRAYPNEIDVSAAGDNVLRILDLVGFSPVHKEVAEQQAEEQRRELAGPNPSPLENLLATRIVVCGLAMGFFEGQRAGVLSKGATVDVCRFHDERVASAQRQYLEAVKMLATIRRLQIPIRVQVNVATAGGQQVNVSGDLALPTNAPNFLN